MTRPPWTSRVSRATTSGTSSTAVGPSARRSPPDRTFAGIDSVLNDQIERDVRAIVEDMAKNPAANGRIGAAGRRFLRQLDGRGRDRPARHCRRSSPIWTRIAAVEDARRSVDLFADQASSPGRDRDRRRSRRSDPLHGRHRPVGLGLPNRDYYLLTGAKYDAYRTAYRAYIVKMLSLAGHHRRGSARRPHHRAGNRDGQVHWPPSGSRDVEQTYNPMSRAQLASFAPQFEWDRTLAKLGLETRNKSIVGEPSAIAARRQVASATCRFDLEGLSRLPFRPRPRAVPAQGVRRRQLRFLFEDAARRSRPARPVEARRRPGQRSARRGGRPDLRPARIIRPRATGRWAS